MPIYSIGTNGSRPMTSVATCLLARPASGPCCGHRRSAGPTLARPSGCEPGSRPQKYPSSARTTRGRSVRRGRHDGLRRDTLRPGTMPVRRPRRFSVLSVGEVFVCPSPRRHRWPFRVGAVRIVRGVRAGALRWEPSLPVGDRAASFPLAQGFPPTPRRALSGYLGSKLHLDLCDDASVRRHRGTVDGPARLRPHGR